jgi:hypothetical protein
MARLLRSGQQGQQQQHRRESQRRPGTKIRRLEAIL